MKLTQFTAALGALVGGRIYPDTAPANVVLPYIIWQKVGGKPFNYLGGGAIDKHPARIQTIVWAKSRLEASELNQLLSNVCRSDPLFGVDEGAAVDRFESTNLRGSMQDFSFWIEAE